VMCATIFRDCWGHGTRRGMPSKATTFQILARRLKIPVAVGGSAVTMRQNWRSPGSRLIAGRNSSFTVKFALFHQARFRTRGLRFNDEAGSRWRLDVFDGRATTPRALARASCALPGTCVHPSTTMAGHAVESMAMTLTLRIV